MQIPIVICTVTIAYTFVYDTYSIHTYMVKNDKTPNICFMCKCQQSSNGNVILCYTRPKDIMEVSTMIAVHICCYVVCKEFNVQSATNV